MMCSRRHEISRNGYLDDRGVLVGALPGAIHLRVDANRSHSLHALTDVLRGEIEEELGSLPIVRRFAEARSTACAERADSAGRIPTSARIIG
jgi:hypothetical protein